MPEVDRPQKFQLYGQEARVAATQIMMASLNELVTHNPTALKALYDFASAGTEISPDSQQVLKQYGLVERDGRLHDLTRSIVNEIVTFEMGKPVIKNIFANIEEAPFSSNVDEVVATLTTAELLSIKMGMLFDNFGEHLNGYKKIAQYVKGGKPSIELKAAIQKAIAERGV